MARTTRGSPFAGDVPDPGGAEGRERTAQEARLERAAALLLERFRRHDDVEAFARLVELSQPALRTLAGQIVRRMDRALDPEDLVADFLAKLFVDLRRAPRPVARLLALAHTYMRNDARTQVRQARRAQARHRTWQERHDGEVDPTARAHDRDQRRGLHQAGALFLHVVDRCFQSLAEHDRAILIAREVDGLSYARIAERLVLPPNQVGMILQRARLRLAQLVDRTLGRARRAPSGDGEAGLASLDPAPPRDAQP